MRVQIILSCILASAFAWTPEPSKYYGPQHIPVIHNGVPLDTPEVQHARAVHMASVAEAKSRSGYDNGDRYYSGDDGVPHPQVEYDGYLIDTPEVIKAKALLHGGHYRKRRSAGNYIFYTTPMGLKYGVEDYSYQAPVDTYEVQNARTQHLLAHAVAKHSKSSSYSINHIHAPIYAHEIPAIGHDGQPLDTAEVQHAKAMHLAAYHEAAIRNSLGYHGLSNPVDTPEVQHAKLQHFAAHAAIKSKIGVLGNS